MQARTAAARSGESSSNTTRRESARPATSSTTAECRSRSGHREKNEEEEGGASIAIWPASPWLSSSGAGISTLSHISSFGRGSGIERKRRLTQALRPGADDNLAKRQQDYRYDEGGNIVEQTE